MADQSVRKLNSALLRSITIWYKIMYGLFLKYNFRKILNHKVNSKSHVSPYFKNR
jgi:hypothetical protein